MGCLVSERWEGNVRELRNLVESLAVLAPRSEIRPEDLPRENRRSLVPPGSPVAGSAPGSAANRGLTMDEIERRALADEPLALCSAPAF